MSKSLVKKVLQILGSSAVAMSLGISGTSALGKDIILSGGGILLFTGLTTAGVVTATVKGGKKHFPKTTLSNSTNACALPGCCCAPRANDIDVDRFAKHCDECDSKGKFGYYLSSEGQWSYLRRCDKCVNEDNKNTLQSLVDVLAEKYKCDSHLVRCALISIIAEKYIVFDSDVFEITKKASRNTNYGKYLEYKKKIEKSKLLGWLAGVISRSNDKEGRGKELVRAIYNLDPKGFDEFDNQRLRMLGLKN